MAGGRKGRDAEEPREAEAGARERPALWRRVWRRGRRWFYAGLALFFFLTGMEVLVVRWVDPPFTPLMVLRWLGTYRATGVKPEVHYYWTDLRDVPEDFVKQVWVSEDGRFFRHFGVDLIELKAAVEEAWREKKAPRGASTITMQAARSVFLWQGRSFVRKGLELVYTGWMELLLSKRRILELYVNVIEMGDGVYGVEAAARHHFGKPAAELTPAESALLVAILPSPLRWDPAAPGDRVLRRQAVILERSGKVDYPARKLGFVTDNGR